MRYKAHAEGVNFSFLSVIEMLGVQKIAMPSAIKTLKVRVKDKHAKKLRRMAASVNFVWNYINDLSFRYFKQHRVFLTEYDLHPYTTGASKELKIHSQTVQCVAKEYVTRRKQFAKARLRWRKTYGTKRSLGWIPVNTGASCFKEGTVFHNGQKFSVWDSYGLEQYRFKNASFNEDATGRWYFNVVVEEAVSQSVGRKAVGIDLGCKSAATCSTGHKIEGRWYRTQEEALKKAQRYKKKKRARAIHRKIKNIRKDALHHLSCKLVQKNAAVFIGNVSSAKMVKTKMAKSVLDASWGMLKTMLNYKCAYANVVFEVVDEKWTTQTCSSCGDRPFTRPRGFAGLGIREWVCTSCGTRHDRDVNAAKNILAVGLGRLVGGIPVRDRSCA